MKSKNSESQVIQQIGAFADMVSKMEQSAVYENLMATERVAPEIRRRQFKEGTMGLPPLLDRRRIEYSIPNGLFREQASFDRVFLYQVRLDNRGTVGDESTIALTNMGKQRELESAPYGIVISAGLPALDSLRSNGIDLGHIVGFIREAPWRKPADYIEGTEFYIMLLRVGDITGSVDLANSLKNGNCRIHVREIKNDDGIVTREHVYVDDFGQTWNPSQPFIPADQ